VIEELARRLRPGGDPFGRFLQAAVIVALAERDGGPAALLELRSRTLARSPGEVGLPGGRLEPGEGAWEAGLRELEEELGIPPGRVRRIGELPLFERGRGELIHAFVAALESPFEVRPGPEVEEAFWLPLAALRDPGFRQAEIREQARLAGGFPRRLLPGRRWRRRGRRSTPYLQYEGRLIWGLTAEILAALAIFL
jgi:8-oxo-dGTP pyrophosphatase MutT (NUDIX family)